MADETENLEKILEMVAHNMEILDHRGSHLEALSRELAENGAKINNLQSGYSASTSTVLDLVQSSNKTQMDVVRLIAWKESFEQAYREDMLWVKTEFDRRNNDVWRWVQFLLSVLAIALALFRDFHK